MGELMPGFEPVVPWWGIFVPTCTSDAFVSRINKDVFSMVVRTDYERLRKTTQQLNLKVD